MFSVSTKGRYATRAMLELALRNPDIPVRLEDISKAQKISVKYLGRLMAVLVTSGLVLSRRGKKGGFTLAASPSKIRILDIVQAVEGPVLPAPCVYHLRACRGPADCVSRDVWMQVKDALIATLAGITLNDLVQRHRKKMLRRPGRIVTRKITKD
jgi:Rrf2 family transcriptional regulator, cysteine metabolism repressor